MLFDLLVRHYYIVKILGFSFIISVIISFLSVGFKKNEYIFEFFKYLKCALLVSNLLASFSPMVLKCSLKAFAISESLLILLWLMINLGMQLFDLIFLGFITDPKFFHRVYRISFRE